MAPRSSKIPKRLRQGPFRRGKSTISVIRLRVPDLTWVSFLLYSQIHEAYQTLINMTPAPPPMSRDTSGFTSPPSTPASKPSNFYSQNAGSTSSWASSGPSSNTSTPRTSTDELPTPKASKHARTHSKTSTNGFRRARTRTLSRVKKRQVFSFALVTLN